MSRRFHRALRSPAEFTKRGWREVLTRTGQAMSAHNMPIVAAGIAFYMVWALFPALVALVLLGITVLGEQEMLHLLSRIRVDLPSSVDAVVGAQLSAIARQSRAFSSSAFIGSVAVALWGAMRGARGLIEALNLIHRQRETRSFGHRQALAFGFACLGGGFLIIAISLIVAVPPFPSGSDGDIESIPLAPWQWPILIGALMSSLAIVYRYGPARRKAKWRWVSWGAAASAIVWVIGSFLFSYYASRYMRANLLLGSLGAATIFMLWSYLTVLTLLFGAQINVEMEREADVETTLDR